MKDAEASPEGALFRVIRSERPSPLICAAPHAGRFYPGGYAEALQANGLTLRSLEDPWTDRLIEGLDGLGAALLVSHVARAFVDVNRDPAEIDPLLTEAAPRALPATPRTKAGLGVVPRLGSDGKAVHRRRLTLAETEARIALAHRPYHDALAGLMTEARERFGFALLIDWHSMPSAAAEAERRRSGLRPDIVLGDRYGKACGGEWSGALRAAFEVRGRRVAMNRPYAGGFVTQTWGRPEEGFHAIQVEIDRALYLDETSLEPGPGFDRLRDDVRAAVTEVLARLQTKKAAPESAA